MRWSIHLKGGPRRVNHAAVAIDDKIYSFGGYCMGEARGRNVAIDVRVLDPMENKWSIVVVQGVNPPTRYGHTAVVWNDRMYVFGGFEDETQRLSRETYCFDFLTKAWTQVMTQGTPPSRRDYHTACVGDGKMWVFGGRSDAMGQSHSGLDIYCDQLRCLDLHTERWSLHKATGDRPCGRRSHSAWVYDDEMYIFGGYISSTDAHFNDTYAFNPSTCRWRRIKPVGAPPCARRSQCTVVLADRVFLFGGSAPQRAKKDELLALGDLHVLDLAPNADTRLLQTVVEMPQVV
ncbi:kelch domain-containing protein 3 isoform 2 [Aphelenchoides avenae]|nr:kelch domain-containing protein 3 isoform 2 [Aphelenchus avenae]